MSREAHVRFWEGAGVRFPRATHLPLERQVRMMRNDGLFLDSQTPVSYTHLTLPTSDLV